MSVPQKALSLQIQITVNMIENISIAGYKSIKQMSLDLKPINILIGANGSGKSNFISYFKLVDSIFLQRLHFYTMQHNAEDLMYFGLKHTQEIKSEIKCRDSKYSFSLHPRANGSLFLTEESCFNENGQLAFQKINADESELQKQDAETTLIMCNHLQECKYYHFHDTSETSPLRMKSYLEDNRSLAKDGANLASILYLLKEKHAKSFKRLELVLQSVMPYFERFYLEPSLLDSTKIELQWIDKNAPDKYFSARDLSDGSIRFIALATLLMQPKLPELIIIDEPELGLHPLAISKLSGLIRSASSRGSQIIIATQSAELISNFDVEDIVTVDKANGASAFKRLNKKELDVWLREYSLGELWNKSIINGQPK